MCCSYIIIDRQYDHMDSFDTGLHGIEGALLLVELYDVNFGIFDFIPIYNVQ